MSNTTRTLHALARFAMIAIIVISGVSMTAAAQIAVVGNTVEEHVAAPGTSYTGAIVVRNLTQQSQPVRIYQTDYLFYADGTSHFDDPGTTPRSNAKWITPSIRSLLVPAMGEMTVTYTVAVPADTSLSGSYWSTIMVEGAPSGGGA